MKQSAALIPVPFSSLKALIATASRFCSRESTLLKPRAICKPLCAGDVLRLALLAPELRYAVEVKATLLARTFKPVAIKVRYELADLGQVESALGQLYRHARAELPVAIDVCTSREVSGPMGRCRLSSLSCEDATFEVVGKLEVDRCAPDTAVRLQLPCPYGRLDLRGQVACVTPRARHSQLRVSFTSMGDDSRRMLGDIVYRFRLGAAPWTASLQAPGL